MEHATRAPRPDPAGQLYQEWSARLCRGAVWTLTVPAAPTNGAEPLEPLRVLPDGSLDLIHGPAGLMVAGPDVTAQLVRPVPGHTWVGLRFPPGIGPVVLGVPAIELRDRRVRLSDVWGAGPAGRLERGLAGLGPEQVGGMLDDVAGHRLATARDHPGPGRLGPDPDLEHVVQLLRRGSRVDAAASAVGLGERRLHRRSLVAFGYGAKTLARILRFHRALDLVRAGVSTAQAAADAGYADQAHLARDARALAGVPLSALVLR